MLMRWATTASSGCGAGASTRRTTQPSSVAERRRAPRRAAVKVASPHWVGGNVLTKPNRVLIVQVPSDRAAPREPRMKHQVVRCSGSRAACSPEQPPRYAYVPGSDQEGLVPAAATAGLARCTRRCHRLSLSEGSDGDGRDRRGRCPDPRARQPTPGLHALQCHLAGGHMTAGRRRRVDEGPATGFVSTLPSRNEGGST